MSQFPVRYLHYDIVQPIIAPSLTQIHTPTPASAEHFALLLLNLPFEISVFHHLWSSSTIRILVDGAVNRIFTITQHNSPITHSQLPPIDSPQFLTSLSQPTPSQPVETSDQFNTSQPLPPKDILTKYCSFFNITFTPLFPSEIPPDLLIGDLDSANPIISTYLHEYYGTNVHKSDCQDTTDFQKALNYLAAHKHDITSILHPSNATPMQSQQHTHQLSKPITINTCLSYNACGGRFDQSMAIISALHQYATTFFRMLLLGDHNLIEIVHPNTLLNLSALRSLFQPRTQHVDTDSQPNNHISTASTSTSNPIPPSLFSSKHSKSDPNPIHCGVIPFLGATQCVWSGLEWNLGDDDLTTSFMGSLINEISTMSSSHSSPTHQPVYDTTRNDDQANQVTFNYQLQLDNALLNQFVTLSSHSVQCEFNGLISTNNRLKPVQYKDPVTQTTSYFAFFTSSKPLVLSISYEG